MLGLYFGGTTTNYGFRNELGNIEFDLLMEESHEWKSDVTSNPVEDGSPVTDHIIEQADKLTLKGLITETPIISASVRDYNISLTQNAYDVLRKLAKERQTVTVYTLYQIYTDMAISNITIPRAASTGEALEVQIEFVNIRKVQTQLVDVPPGISSKKSAKSGGANGATAKKSEPKKDAGKKQAEVENRSQLKALANQFLRLGG